MKAEFLYKHLIVAKIANWCYVKTMQQQELRVCLFITQESIHAYVRNKLHPQTMQCKQ
jgi:predicted XRE-type DNA-binding protein